MHNRWHGLAQLLCSISFSSLLYTHSIIGALCGGARAHSCGGCLASTMARHASQLWMHARFYRIIYLWLYITQVFLAIVPHDQMSAYSSTAVEHFFSTFQVVQSGLSIYIYTCINIYIYIYIYQFACVPPATVPHSSKKHPKSLPGVALSTPGLPLETSWAPKIATWCGSGLPWGSLGHLLGPRYQSTSKKLLSGPPPSTQELPKLRFLDKVTQK